MAFLTTGKNFPRVSVTSQKLLFIFNYTAEYKNVNVLKKINLFKTDIIIETLKNI